jgi:hypothetical protein
VSERFMGLIARPGGWFLFQIAELVVLGLAIKLAVPADWSRSLELAVVGPILLVVVVFNYRLRRRLPAFFEIPEARDADEDSGGPGTS